MAPPAASLSLSDIYYVLFRQKWKILFCAVLGIAAAIGVKFVMKSDYRSGAKLFVRFVVTNGDPLSLPEDAKLKTPDQRGETIMNSEIQILTSLDLAREVAQAVGPERILAATGGGNDLTAAAAMIRGGLIVSAPAKSSIISIFFEHPDSAVVQPVLREIVERYMNMHKNIHGKPGIVDDALRQETDQLRNRLARTEEELRRAQARINVVQFAEAKQSIGEQMETLQSAIRTAQAELAERTAVTERIAQGMGTQVQGSDSDPVPSSEALSEYRSVVGRVETLRRREMDLLNQFTAESTRVQEVRQLLTEAIQKKTGLEEAHPGLVRAFMATEPTSTTKPGSGGIDLNTESARLAGIQSRIKTLIAQLNEVRARAAELDEAEGAIAQLQRRRDLEEQSYRRYATSLEQLRINEALGAGRVSNISVVENPTPAGRDPWRVRKIQAGVAAAGLALGLGWAFLIEFVLDRSVRRSTDIERMGRLPLFISIPQLSRKQLRGNRQNGSSSVALMEANGTRPAGLDANHALRPFHETLRDRMISYFDARGLTHKPKLVAITSIGTKAGTTVTATGLAASLSETGDGNVLLVDLTPGQNTAHHFQRGKPILGLEETLETKGERLAVQDNLYIAAGGQSDQLSRVLPRQFTKLMPKLRASDFDYIIFDMPPVSQISITPRLAEYMDMVFIVVESEKTSRDTLQRASEMLNDTGANVGIILNKNRSYVPAGLDGSALN